MSIRNNKTRYQFLSFIIPGLWAFCNKKPYKGIAFFLILIFLIFVGSTADFYEDKLLILFISFLFYFYQIFDGFYDSREIRKLSITNTSRQKKESVSFFWSVFVLLIGIIFQLANFDLFSYSQILKHWPLLLLLFGVQIVLIFLKGLVHESN